MNRNFDNLKYTDEIMYSIKNNIYLLGIVESVFPDIAINNPKVKIYPNNKFFYNFCPFHNNSGDSYDFFVDENHHLYYCFGCGARGNAFDFLMNRYNIDINSATKILGVISGLFDFPLSSEEMKIYNSLIKNYNNYNDLLKKSGMKTAYLTSRVKRYLELHPLKDEPTFRDFKKIADRLSCSVAFVEKMYRETPYYKEYNAKKSKELILKNNKMFFE